MTDIFVSRQDDQRQTEIALSLLPMFEGKRAFVRTFGCQQNESDGEKLMGYLMLCGFSRATSESDADLILINTCAIREHAEKRELSYAGQLKKLKENKKDLIIGICGCMPQQLHRVEQIKKSYPYVDFAFGTDMNHRLPEILYSVVHGTKRMFFINDLPHDSFGVISEGMPVCRASSYKAWVSIMYGCNNFCTYCVVPFVRGRERSRRSDDVLNEVSGLITSGYKDITLLGQNVNSYNGDITFPELISKCAEFDGDYRIRFMTSHPKDASDELIDAIASHERIAKHFHLPVQSGSTRILTEMNRRYTREQYLETAQKIRDRVPDIAVSTDIIVGFPGETDEDFADTLSLVKEAQFDMIYSFIYSPREGTKAARMDCRIPHDEQVRRFEMLSALQNDIALERNKALVGTVQRVLSDGDGTGRTDQNKIAELDMPIPAGEVCKAEITSAKAYSLSAKIIK